MTREEAVEAYTDRFGGFPYFLFMGCPDEELVRRVEEALRDGEQVRPEEGRVY